MKITLMNILSLFLFALAAFSAPVTTVQEDVHPYEAPSTRGRSFKGLVEYRINGQAYDETKITAAIGLYARVQRGKQVLLPEQVVIVQKLAIEGLLLNLEHAPGFNTNYDGMRSSIQGYMSILIDTALLPDTRLSNDPTVILLAKHALKTCLEWEKEHNHTYDDVLPDGRASLDHQDCLKALKRKIKGAINSKPVSPTRKRGASDDDGHDNEPVNKMIRLFDETHDVQMTG
ncbi:hypothetical protein H0H93_001437 [Arthromyces matolae]|nr:hypothetical protein H0H93_001437 [Arthromyces matolae]